MAQPYNALADYQRVVAQDEDRALRREALLANLELSRANARRSDRRESRLADYQDRQLDTAEQRTRTLAEIQREGIAARREAMANRPRPQGQIVQTAEGVFERTPGGLQRLNDPATGRPLTPKVGEKPVTEFQGKNALYGSRAMMADGVLNQLEDSINQEGLAVKQSAQGIPVVGGLLGAAGNALLSASQQRVEQAQRNFVNAVLRQESGAVISDPEFENAKKQYFRQPGDTDEVVKQKRANRKAAIMGFKKIAGPAWPGDAEVMGIEGSSPAPAGGWDDAKERRYQELRRKRGGAE